LARIRQQRATEKAGLAGRIYFRSFDLSDEISRGIKIGAIDFAIGQLASHSRCAEDGSADVVASSKQRPTIFRTFGHTTNTISPPQ
jgi:hypothetical protein